MIVEITHLRSFYDWKQQKYPRVVFLLQNRCLNIIFQKSNITSLPIILLLLDPQFYYKYQGPSFPQQTIKVHVNYFSFRKNW